MKVRCPNCRNEQDIEKKGDERCIVCGYKLSDGVKLFAPVIKEDIVCPREEIKQKQMCEICGIHVATTMIDEAHPVCKRCKWKRINQKGK